MAIYMWRDVQIDYLCFTANTAGSKVQLYKNGSPTEVTLETSTDGSNWTTYTFNTYITLSNIGDKVYFRNTSTTTTGFNTSAYYYQFTMTGSIAASGDITYLINKNGTDTISGTYSFKSLFAGCDSLTSAPKLPATTLTNYCYYEMFNNCSNLETLPELPAIELKNNCYNLMFYGCAKIKVSMTQTGIYQTPYRIPTTGTGTVGTDSLLNMFYNTGGTFTGTPSINTTYYTSNQVI